MSGFVPCSNCRSVGYLPGRARTRRRGTKTHNVWVVCLKCDGYGVVELPPPVTPDGELTVAAAQYYAGSFKPVVQAALDLIARRSPTFATHRRYLGMVHAIVQLNLNCPSKDDVVDDIMTAVVMECRRRRVVYNEAATMRSGVLRIKVSRLSAETGRKPVKRTREALAAFYALAQPITHTRKVQESV